MARAMGNPYALESFGNPALPFAARDPPADQGHFDILGDVEIVDQIEALEDEAHHASTQDRQVPLGRASDILAEERVNAARRAVEQPEDIEQCGFSTPGGS